jgi:pimeloyl-ACP methyl ester carboxylesterase
MTRVTAPTMIPDLHPIPGCGRSTGTPSCRANCSGSSPSLPRFAVTAWVRRHPRQELLHVSYVATFAGCDRSCLPLWTALERSNGAECLRKLTAPEGQDPRRTDERWAISRGQRLAAASQQGAVKTGEHRPRRSGGCGRRHEQARSELPNKTTYDWRRDNRVAARRLKEQTNRWLGEWRREQPDAKLILVGHSMGGLVARYFLECLEGWRDTRRWSPLAPRTGGCPVSLVQAPDLSCRRRPPCCRRRQAAVLPSIN